jgi:polysaccharide biosynthesis protein PelF
MAEKRLKVMMTTEGTYPHGRGGVSTWCDILVKRLDTVDYLVYSILMNPFVEQKFALPPNARLLKVPLWGTEDPSEHLVEIPFSQVYAAKRRTDLSVVRKDFIPMFDVLIDEMISEEKDSTRLAHTFLDMYRFFQVYDYKSSFKEEVIWERFKEIVLQKMAHTKGPTPTLFDLTQSLGWLYRFFVILNTPLPAIDVTHSAAAAFCGIPGVLAKLDKGTPFLLTEHGVYLREQYLSRGRIQLSSYLKLFMIQMVRSIAELNYQYADQISPVCAYNTRWEREMGVSQDRIKVIYNGVDPTVFQPSTQVERKGPPTVVGVMRVDPVKDIETLLRSAEIVRREIRDVKFIIYGAVSVSAYYERCLELRKELGLEDTFIFAGHTDNVADAYRSGDVVALSSITEAFPYSVVEAMMVGKPVVATDVGGVNEALGSAGVSVPPRNPEAMAQALIRLLRDPEERQALGEEARQRALTYFTITRAVNLYLQSYMALYEKSTGYIVVERRRNRQNLFAQRGYAMAEMALWEEAIAHFRLAIEIDMQSAAVPMLLAEIARAYNELGHPELAMNELEKAQALATFFEKGEVA